MEPDSDQFTVGIFEDNPIVSQGLTSYFENSFSYPLKVIFSSTDPIEFVEQYKSQQPDFLIIDVISDKVLGLEVFEIIFKFDEQAIVLAYSNVKSKRIIQTLISLGVVAYVPKTEPIDVFEDAFNAILKQRKTYLPEYLKDVSRKKEVPIALTKMEKKIVPFLIDGKSSKEIATAFFITVDAVSYHKKNLFNKFKVNNIASFVKEVIAQGYSGGIHY